MNSITLDKEDVKYRMDSGFSVFNLHLNDAGKRADAEFAAQFGQEVFDREIKPCRDDGIMSIFQNKPNQFTSAWVALVTAYVNEDRVARPAEVVDGPHEKDPH